MTPDTVATEALPKGRGARLVCVCVLDNWWGKREKSNIGAQEGENDGLVSEKGNAKSGGGREIAEWGVGRVGVDNSRSSRISGHPQLLRCCSGSHTLGPIWVQKVWKIHQNWVIYRFRRSVINELIIWTESNR